MLKNKFFNNDPRVDKSRILDYEREMVLVVESQHPYTGAKEILAVARLSKLHGINEAEFALLVSDPFQKQSMGTELLRRLVQIGREEHLERIKAEILPENCAMQHVCEKVGFRLRRTPDLVLAEIELE